MNKGLMETKCVDQRIEELELDKITTGGYQRPLNERRVEKIAAQFDPAKLGLLLVSQREHGRYAILDGQHRLAALRAQGYGRGMAIVLSGLSVDEEANYFRRQNENVTRLNALDLYNAGLMAGDHRYLEIERILTSHGFKVGKEGTPMQVAAVATLAHIVTQFGFQTLDTVFAYIRAAWPTDRTAVRREMLAGFTEFALRYGGKVKPEQFGARMRDKLPSDLFHEHRRRCAGDAHARSAFKPSVRYVLCGVLVEAYNKGLGSQSRQRLMLKWDGPRLEYDQGGHW